MSSSLRLALCLLILLAGGFALQLLPNSSPGKPTEARTPAPADPPQVTVQPQPKFDASSHVQSAAWIMGRLKAWNELRNNVIAFDKEKAAILAAGSANKGEKVNWFLHVESVGRSPGGMAKVEFDWTRHQHNAWKHFKVGVGFVIVPEPQAADLIPGKLAQVEGVVADFGIERETHSVFPSGTDELLCEYSGWWILKDVKITKLP